MSAIVQEKYGFPDVPELQGVDKPVAQEDLLGDNSGKCVGQLAPAHLL